MFEANQNFICIVSTMPAMDLLIMFSKDIMYPVNCTRSTVYSKILRSIVLKVGPFYDTFLFVGCFWRLAFLGYLV